jgi:hypothetical protein
MPAGLLVTVPDPEPEVVTVSCTGAAAWSKVAVTEESAPSMTTQLPVPLHPPDQPVNVEPESGVGVSVIWVPLTKLALHVVPQLMPPGLLDTVPPPLPAFCTERWKLTLVWPLTEAHPVTKQKSARNERLKTALKVYMNFPGSPENIGCGLCHTGWVGNSLSRLGDQNSRRIEIRLTVANHAVPACRASPQLRRQPTRKPLALPLCCLQIRMKNMDRDRILGLFFAVFDARKSRFSPTRGDHCNVRTDGRLTESAPHQLALLRSEMQCDDQDRQGPS